MASSMASSKPSEVFEHALEGKALIRATNTFAWELYNELAKGKVGENLFLSPASISIALGMTYLGAKRNTEKQMADVLHFADVSPDHLHKSLSDLQKALNDTSGDYILHTANRLYGHKGFDILKAFLDATQTYYGAELEAVDFVKETEKVRQQINAWVEKQTANKIKDLIPSGALDALTRLVLVNAIYFKGDWLEKFDKTNTKPADFFINPTNKVNVDMMHQTKEFKFGINRDLRVKALELPYKGEKLSMVILLPDERDGLASLESKITSENLNSLDKLFRMSSIKTVVSLPKFKLEDSFSLGETLAALGMSDLFNMGAADLSGIDGKGDLFVSKVVHKAFINVDEEGSEAAAATGVIMMLRSMPRIMEFNADHPFLFLIRQNETGSILFIGRLVQPEAASSSNSGENNEL